MTLLGNQPLHPFLVHFPIAAWTLGAAALCLAAISGKKFLAQHAWLLLATGAALSIPAVLAGQAEYPKMAELRPAQLELHRSFGNAAPWLMGVLVLLRGHYYLRKKSAGPEWPWALAALGVCVFILYTAHLGGLSVYGLIL